MLIKNETNCATILSIMMLIFVLVYVTWIYEPSVRLSTVNAYDKLKN